MPTKIFTKIILPVAIMLFALASCGNKTSSSTEAEKKTAEPIFDLAATRKSVEEANQALSDFLKKGDSTGFAGLYCSDAKMMGPEASPVIGRGAIKSAIGGLYQMGISGASLKTTDVWGSDALVGEEGTYLLSFKDGKEYDHGKYIVLWKMEDGKWKLFRDIWNTDIPRPVAK